jgi:hypothetical protein
MVPRHTQGIFETLRNYFRTELRSRDDAYFGCRKIIPAGTEEGGVGVVEVYDHDGYGVDVGE